MAISLDEVQALAEQLPPSDQAQLIARLAVQLAPPPPPAKPRSDAWQQRWTALRDELAALPAARLAGDQLEADRAERDVMLLGPGDVYP